MEPLTESDDNDSVSMQPNFSASNYSQTLDVARLCFNEGYANSSGNKTDLEASDIHKTRKRKHRKNIIREQPEKEDGPNVTIQFNLYNLLERVAELNFKKCALCEISEKNRSRKPEKLMKQTNKFHENSVPKGSPKMSSGAEKWTVQLNNDAKITIGEDKRGEAKGEQKNFMKTRPKSSYASSSEMYSVQAKKQTTEKLNSARKPMGFFNSSLKNKFTETNRSKRENTTVFSEFPKNLFIRSSDPCICGSTCSKREAEKNRMYPKEGIKVTLNNEGEQEIFPEVIEDGENIKIILKVKKSMKKGKNEKPKTLDSATSDEDSSNRQGESTRNDLSIGDKSSFRNEIEATKFNYEDIEYQRSKDTKVSLHGTEVIPDSISLSTSKRDGKAYCRWNKTEKILLEKMKELDAQNISALNILLAQEKLSQNHSNSIRKTETEAFSIGSKSYLEELEALIDKKIELAKTINQPPRIHIELSTNQVRGRSSTLRRNNRRMYRQHKILTNKRSPELSTPIEVGDIYSTPVPHRLSNSCVVQEKKEIERVHLNTDERCESYEEKIGPSENKRLPEIQLERKMDDKSQYSEPTHIQPDIVSPRNKLHDVEDKLNESSEMFLKLHELEQNSMNSDYDLDEIVENMKDGNAESSCDKNLIGVIASNGKLIQTDLQLPASFMISAGTIEDVISLRGEDKGDLIEVKAS